MSTPPSAPSGSIPPVTPVPPPRSRSVWRVVLVVSLALNVLVAGVVIGGYIRMQGPAGSAAVGGPTDMRGLWRALPDEARGALRAQQSERGDRRVRAQEAGRDGAAIVAAISAEPFDAEALVAVIEGQRQRNDAARRDTTRAFAEQVQALSPQQRQAMARDLRRIWRRQLPE